MSQLPTLALLEPAPSSAAVGQSPCPVQVSCGGCPRLHLSSATQRLYKTQALAQCFAKNKLEFKEPEWLSDGRALGYRNRIRLRLDQGRPAFFNPEKQDHCAVLRPELLESLAAVRHWAAVHDAALSQFHHLEVRVPDLDGNASVSLHFAPQPIGPLQGAGAPREPNITNAAGVLHPPRDFLLALPDIEPPFQRVSVTESVYARCAVTAFMQVNSGVNALLVQTVLALARLSGARRVLDLFSGSGNFSLPLAAAGYEVSAYELDSCAIKGLRLAALEQGLELEAMCQDLRALKPAALSAADLVIANPPRAGLGSLVPNVAALAGQHLILCCCSASSFARDTALLQCAGFQLMRWFAIDMFPGTDHVEVLGYFER